MYRQGPRYEAAAISSIRDAWLGTSHPSGEDTSGGARSFFGAHQMVGDAKVEDVLNNVEVYSRLKQMWDAWGTWQMLCITGLALWAAWKTINFILGTIMRLLGSRALSPLAQCMATLSPAAGYFFQQYPSTHTSKKKKEKEIPSEPEGNAPLLLPLSLIHI